MTLDLCVETYGSVAPFLGTDTVGAVLGSRPHLARRKRQAVPARHGAELVDAILRAADRLPFLLVHALWLIDVCRCSYDEAAVELGTTPEVVAERVAAAREGIRDAIVHDPPGRVSRPRSR